MKASTILFLVVMAFVLLATVVIGAMAYSEFTKQATAKAETQAVIPVHVHKVATGEVEDIAFLTGFVEPGDRVDVIAKIPMPGKLIAANVKKGEMVTKGQVMATVDRDEVGADYRPYPIKAPMDGMVVSIQKDPGSLVMASRPFAAIVNLDEVKVRASIIESDMVRVKTENSARIRVDAKPDQVFDGSVSLVESVLDAYAHTAPIEITIQNSSGELLPGMFARIEVVVDKHSDVPLLPKRAVFKRENKNLCYMIRKDDKGKTRIALTEITLGYFDGNNYEVLSGVVPDDLVVDAGLVVLKDQTEVKVENPDGAEPETAAGSTAEPAAGSTAAPAEGSTAAPASGSTAAPAEGATAPASGATPAETPAAPAPAPASGATPAAGSTAPVSGATVTPATP